MYILKQWHMASLSKSFDGSHVYCFTPYHLYTMTLWTQQPTQLQLCCAKPCASTRFECTKQEKGSPETRQATKTDKGQQVK